MPGPRSVVICYDGPVVVLPCSPLLGLFPLIHVISVSWTPNPDPSKPPSGPFGHTTHLLFFPSRQKSGCQLVDVSQPKASVLLSQSQSLDGPPGLSAPEGCPVHAPWYHLSGPCKLPSVKGPRVNLPAWQLAEHYASASSSCPKAPVLSLSLQVMTWSLTMGSAGSELTRGHPDLNSCFFWVSSGPQSISAQGLKSLEYSSPAKQERIYSLFMNL